MKYVWVNRQGNKDRGENVVAMVRLQRRSWWRWTWQLWAAERLSTDQLIVTFQIDHGHGPTFRLSLAAAQHQVRLWWSHSDLPAMEE